MTKSILWWIAVAALGLSACASSKRTDAARLEDAGAGTGSSSAGSTAAGTRAANGGGHGGSTVGAAGRNASAGNGAAGRRGGAGTGAGTGTGAGAGTGAAGRNGAAGTQSGAGGAAAGSGAPGTGAIPNYDDVKKWISDYAMAHPGQDGDFLGKSPSAIAADADAQRLLSLCGANQRPVIPQLVWETGGADHAWIKPEQSALVYCVYIPVSPSSAHWQYDAAMDRVRADVYVLYPDHNPCKADIGADQVVKCIGEQSNFEILVDTASLHDGADVGLSLSEAVTELRLVSPDGSAVHLWMD